MPQPSSVGSSESADVENAEQFDDEAAYFEVRVPEPTIEQRLGLYRIYKEMGGHPYEPNETWLRQRESEQH